MNSSGLLRSVVDLLCESSFSLSSSLEDIFLEVGVSAGEDGDELATAGCSRGAEVRGEEEEVSLPLLQAVGGLQ